MSRQRDYQPTIDRARNQAEIAKAREAKIRAKKDECHRDMLRAQNAARIANEEADALRDRILGLEQAFLDIKADNRSLRAKVELRGDMLLKIHAQLEDAKHPYRSAWRRLKASAGKLWRAILSTAAEA